MICRSCRSSFRAQLGQRPSSRHSYATINRGAYDDTIHNLKIGKHTRVIFQGFTGKQATANARESIEWGTNIVGGVTPKKEGEHLGLPVLPTVRRAVEELKPDATGIYVAAHQAPAAIEEAIEAEIPLIVAVAEHIPLHNILKIHQMLKTQSKSRLVGANAPGIISAIGHCRIGFQPLSCYTPGHVGVIAKSGTLSYEAVGSLTREGVGQSLCIGMGGDVIAGTDLVDGLRVFETDNDTKAIVLIGEVGGTAEEEAAEWIKDYRKRVKNPKPIAALVGGICAKPGKVMGHAGAWAAPGEGVTRDKWRTFEDAGAIVVDHPEKFGPLMKNILTKAGHPLSASVGSSFSGSQKRGFHTMRTRPAFRSNSVAPVQQVSKRSLHLRTDQGETLLNQHGIKTSPPPSDESDSRLLVLTVARSARSPCILVSPTTNGDAMHQRSVQIPYDYAAGPQKEEIARAIERLQFSSLPTNVQARLGDTISKLSALFKEKEAISLEVRLSLSPDQELQVYNPKLFFDDAAFKSTKRQHDLHALRDTSLEDPAELAAEPDGIVYVKLDAPTKDDAPRNIGTLVNGAGLAMNTVDALETHGGFSTNFLDTGGKATSETVKKSFELILKDDRVKVIFVNIFGGLTLGDMIARGVILAFKELDMKVPVVVRIRGTNEKEGQQLIAESGLDLFAFDDFASAAKKVVELANGSSEAVKLDH